MPTYEVRAPDGNLLEFEGPEGATQDELLAYAQRMYQPKQRAEDVGFIPGSVAAAKRGVESLGDVASGLGLAGTALTGTEAETRAKMQAIKAQQAIPENIPGMTAEGIQKLYQEKGLGAAAAQVPKYISENILQAAPQMAIPLAAGATAAAVSGPFAPIVGPIVGMGTYGIQQFGNFLVRQAQEKNDPKELEIAKAATTAAITAPLGYYADRFTTGLTTLGTKKAGEEILKELTARELAAKVGKRVAVGATEGVIAEAPVEVLEQAAERYQAGLDLTNDDAKREFKEAFYGAAAAGGGIGGATRGVQAYREGKAQPPVPTPEEPIVAPTEAAGVTQVPTSPSMDTEVMMAELEGREPRKTALTAEEPVAAPAVTPVTPVTPEAPVAEAAPVTIPPVVTPEVTPAPVVEKPQTAELIGATSVPTPEINIGAAGQNNFAFMDKGEVKSIYGNIITKGGREYIQYKNEQNQSRQRLLTKDVVVNPTPDHMELLQLYKAREKADNIKDNFLPWLKKYGISTAEKADMGIEKSVKKGLPVGLFKEEGYGLDELARAAVNDGILTESDLQDGVGGVESMRNLIYDTLYNQGADTTFNMNKRAELYGINQRIQELETALEPVPEEAIVEQIKQQATETEEATTLPIDYSKSTVEQAALHEQAADLYRKDGKDANVIYQNGDLGLIKTRQKNGDVIYMPVKGSKYSQYYTDIESSQGKQLMNALKLTPEQQKELLDVKKDAEFKEKEKHKTTPFLKIKKGVSGSAAMPKDIVNVARNWANMLGMKYLDIHIMTKEEGIAAKDLFTGPHRPVGYMAQKTSVGAVRRLDDNTYVMIVNPSTSKSKMLETISHELGHIHEKLAFEDESNAVKNAIIKDFNAWFNTHHKISAKELVESMRPRTMAKTTQFANATMQASKADPYWRSFGEWYADQVARWAVSSEKPLTVVDKFFKKLADALRKFYATVKGQGYLPTQSMKEFLDKVALQNQVDEIVDRNNKGQMALFAKDLVESANQTNTPEFKRWFGDSKVVDEDGNPLVMNHATAGEVFNVFEKEKIRPVDYDVSFNGFWFSSDKFTSPAMRDPKNVISAYLSVKNPAPNSVWRKVSNQVYDEFNSDKREQALRPGARSINDEVRGRLQDMGYDGIHYSGTPSVNKKELESTGQTTFQKPSGAFYTLSKNTEDGGLDLYSGKTTENHITGYLDLNDYLQSEKEQVWVAFEPNQIKSAISNTGAFNPEDADIRYSERVVSEEPAAKVNKHRNIEGEIVSPVWNSPEMSKIDNFLYKLQDKHIDTKRVIQAIQKEAGQLEDNWNVYLKEELYHGRTSAALRKFLLQDLMPAIKQMSKLGISPDDMKTYLHNRHAKERNDQIAKIRPATLPDGRPNPNAMTDKGSGLSYKQVDDYFSKLDPAKAKKLEEVAKEFDSMIQGTQKILVSSGAEPQSAIDSWNKAYKNYVPLFRADDDFATHPSQGTGAGFSSSGAASKRAMGSEKEVQDILGNIIAQRERALIKAEKIRVGRALYGLAIKSPNPNFWLPVNPDAIKDPEALAYEIDSLGLDGKDVVGLMEEVKRPEIIKDPKTGLQTVRYKINPLERYKDNVFPVRVNGKDRYIFFNQNDPRAKRMVEAMKNLDTEQLGDALGMIGKLTRWFAAVNTQYNPVFGGINLLRDVQGAAINLSTTKIAGEQKAVTAGVFPAMKTIFATLKAERNGQPLPNTDEAKLWEEFKTVGGQTLYRDSLTRKAEEKQLVDHELNRMKRGPASRAFSATAQLLSDFNDTIENSVRFSAYKVAIEKGLSKEQAASIAKNLTVNFDRKGQLGSRINALYAFFNASVQGTARLAETIKGPAGRKIVAGGMALGAIQAIALAAAGFEEDEPPEFIKERNLIIPLPGSKYAMIPMPLGLHFFPNIGRKTTEFVLGGGKNPGKHTAELFGTAMDAFNPVGSTGLSMQTLLPTVVDPLAALEANKDAFGRPIYKADRATNPTPGYTRSRESASEISKLLSEFLNYASGGTEFKKGAVSPTADALDYLAGQFTGGAGREIMKVEQAVKAAATGEELPSYRVPIAGRFIGDTESKAADAQRFYDNVTKMAEHENEIKGRRKPGYSGPSIAEYMSENPEARLWQQTNTAENQISQINKQKKEFQSRGFPPEKIQALEDRKQAIMKRLNTQIKNLQE